MNWTIASGGIEKLVGDWGFSNLQRKLISQSTDELTFTADGSLVDSSQLFTPNSSLLTLYRDRQIDSMGHWTGGTIWFNGIVTQLPRRGQPDAESNAYKVAGPWWFLENRVFEKTFNVLDHLAVPGDFTSGVYVQKSFSHSFLYIGPTAALSQFNLITTGQQIVEALNWALKPFTDTSTPPPFQIGSVTPSQLVPFEEIRDITCAEVVKRCLRWSPDAVAWFDYSTTPPTFNCKQRPGLTTVNLPLNPS